MNWDHYGHLILGQIVLAFGIPHVPNLQRKRGKKTLIEGEALYSIAFGLNADQHTLSHRQRCSQRFIPEMQGHPPGLTQGEGWARITSARSS